MRTWSRGRLIAPEDRATVGPPELGVHGQPLADGDGDIPLAVEQAGVERELVGRLVDQGERVDPLEVGRRPRARPPPGRKSKMTSRLVSRS